MKNRYLLSKNQMGCLFIIGFLIYLYFNAKQNQALLRNKGKTGEALITGYKYIKGLNIIYTFHEKEYLTSTGIGSFEAKKLINRKFPIVYLEGKDEINKILIFKQDFDLYEFQYPDSLKWLCDSLKLEDCKEPGRVRIKY